MCPAVPRVSGRSAAAQRKAARTASPASRRLGVAHASAGRGSRDRRDPGDHRRLGLRAAERPARPRRRGRDPQRRPGPRARASGSAPPPGRDSARCDPGRPRRSRPAISRPRAARARPRRRSASRSGGHRRRGRDRGRGAGVASSAASCSLSIRRARASGWRRQRSIASLPAGQDPGLRPAEQLVGREADDRRAGARVGRRRQARRRSRSSAPEPRSSISGQPRARGERGQLGDGRLLGEADGAEVGLVDAQQRRRALADRRLVVGEPGAVGRADLDQLGRPRARGSRGSGRSRRSRPAGRGRRSPRRPPASAASASSTAAALLLTAIAASAPVSSPEQRLDVVVAAAATRPARGRARGWSSRRPTRRGGLGGLGRERRPAEVGVQDTPVALITRGGCRAPAALRVPLAAVERSAARSDRSVAPARIPARAPRSISSRAAATRDPGAERP